ncbi:cupin domain-containing protein [Cupriavidus necator]|uniref:(S)-ureidoglycine aminohydrolase cupin domain-containing protein n=1 Tax=Cupriavidus pinatubonensis (strain JMP 134 / LMG 1197) TaxID=264198 RepID=Q46NQ0_CUPPJ|nr:cupin domain-containing protein [Cupriavidus necator]
MSIQIVHSSSTTNDLTNKGMVPVPLSEPACQIAALEVKVRERLDCKTGIWECSPGRFERQSASGEVMHILCGSGEFAARDGTVYAFKSGDTLFFPPDTYGTWTIQETLRKVYVLI